MERPQIRTVLCWLVFCALQVAGFITLSFTNVHSNIVPLFIGIVFLMPAGLLLFFLNIPFVAMVVVVITLNGAAWWSMWRWGGAEWWPDKSS